MDALLLKEDCQMKYKYGQQQEQQQKKRELQQSCISQNITIKIIAILSIAFGTAIFLTSVIVIITNTKPSTITFSKQQLSSKSLKSADKYDLPSKLWNYIELHLELRTIAVIQILTSLCLLTTFKELHKFGLPWIIFHIVCVIATIYYVWKKKDDNNNSSQQNNKILDCLTHLIVINLCMEIFFILVIIHFLKHPFTNVITNIEYRV